MQIAGAILLIVFLSLIAGMALAPAVIAAGSGSTNDRRAPPQCILTPATVDVVRVRSPSSTQRTLTERNRISARADITHCPGWISARRLSTDGMPASTGSGMR